MWLPDRMFTMTISLAATVSHKLTESKLLFKAKKTKGQPRASVNKYTLP